MPSTDKHKNGLSGSQESACELDVQVEGRLGGYGHLITLGDTEIPGIMACHQNLVL